MHDVADAITYLHNRDIVHRDIKPENLLYVTENPDSDLVVADFGIAKTLSSPEEKLTTMAGSFGYAAPEVLRGTGHGKPCDVWSFGVVTYTVLSGYSPFRSETVNEFLQEVTPDFEPVFHVKYWRHVSEDAKRFVRSLLKYNPDHRPTAAQVLADPWLTGLSKHTTDDLLPNIRDGFNARQKLRLAIEAVRLANRIKALQMQDEGSDEEDVKDKGRLDPFQEVQQAFVPQHGRSGSGARFHEVVLAAARHKQITGIDPGSEDDISNKSQ
jgi:calcium/calmodulin-dependent protein kinase I